MVRGVDDKYVFGRRKFIWTHDYDLSLGVRVSLFSP